uniref:Uncharacterized protein n=1 Tax=Ananas comosus var. bracteatus TaxID=296719 RepID=A0A6V7QB51_ANACO|nr:unnamed protein product [Ananas comosus var. bracteatus]
MFYLNGCVDCSLASIRHCNLPFESYKFDPNAEYVRRKLLELDSVLQAAGVELGSNYHLLPIVEIDAAKAKLQEALAEMQQQEAASRAAIENGTEEGLGDSSELPMIDLPQRDSNGGGS